MADDRFIDLDRYAGDLKRLSRLFWNIGVIRLMGGEPLLYDRINDAVALTRKFFRWADIRIVTNGVLLPKMSETFWRACRENRVQIDLSKYPVSLNMERISGIAAGYGVPLNVREINEFFAGLNLRGDSDPAAAMKKCRSMFYCPYLQDGKLYVCSIPATVHYFNREFGTSIPSDGAIDIHSNLTGRQILTLLETPIPACQYCTAGDYPTYAWAVSRHSRDEWDADSNLVQIAPLALKN